MKVEASFSASSKIFFLPEPGKRDGHHCLPLFRLGNEIVAAAIRKAYVGEHHIKLLRIASVQCSCKTVRHDNLKTKVTKQVRKDATRLAVIFDH